MANEFVPFKQKDVDYTLRDLLDLHTREVLLQMNCHAVANITSFDETNQTVQATVNYKQTVLQPQQDGTFQQTLLDYPLLLDVPMIVLGGVKGSIQPPDPTGSDCLILFNDRSISDWFQGSAPGALSSSRLHAFGDGIALVGLNSMAHSIDDYDKTRMTMRYGTTKVACSATKVLVTNSGGQSLGTILGNLMTALSTFTTAAGSATTAPQIATAAATLGTSVTSITTQLSGLLE
jgi:hypothetical protein